MKSTIYYVRTINIVNLSLYNFLHQLNSSFCGNYTGLYWNYFTFSRIMFVHSGVRLFGINLRRLKLLKFLAEKGYYLKPLILQDREENKGQTEIFGALYTEMPQRSLDSLRKIPSGTAFRSKPLNPTKTNGGNGNIRYKKMRL